MPLTHFSRFEFSRNFLAIMAEILFRHIAALFSLIIVVPIDILLSRIPEDF